MYSCRKAITAEICAICVSSIAIKIIHNTASHMQSDIIHRGSSIVRGLSVATMLGLVYMNIYGSHAHLVRGPI